MDPTLLSSFYTDDAAFEGSVRRSAAQLKLLMDWGPACGYFPNPDKSIFIVYNPEAKEAAKREFEQASLHLNYVGVSRYMGAFLGPREEL